MTLLIDLGNTRLKLAALVDGRIGEVAAIPHVDPKSFGSALQQALDVQATPAERTQAWLCNVHRGPAATLLRELLAERGFDAVEVDRAVDDEFLQLGYDDPRELGVDRWLAMRGALLESPGPLLLVMVGTAITLDLIDGRRRHLGGAIAPSPQLMLDALRQRAPQLPEASWNAGHVFARSTREGLGAGCFHAALGLVENALREAEQRLGQVPELWLGGGGGAGLAVHLPAVRLREHLVLDGLADLAMKARETG